jgi:hypothetical protein
VVVKKQILKQKVAATLASSSVASLPTALPVSFARTKFALSVKPDLLVIVETIISISVFVNYAGYCGPYFHISSDLIIHSSNLPCLHPPPKIHTDWSIFMKLYVDLASGCAPRRNFLLCS